jgi:hypothetical protein
MRCVRAASASAALRARASRIVKDGRLRGDNREYDYCRRHRLPVPADEFADSIRQTVGLSFERLSLQVMIDISNQRFNGSVSPLGIFMHRGEAQHVEIAPRCFAGARNSRMFGRHGGRLLRFAAHDGEFRFGRRFLRQVERKPSGQ